MKGDVVLVAFWASWCVPNARELEDFQKLARETQALTDQVNLFNRIVGMRAFDYKNDEMQSGLWGEISDQFHIGTITGDRLSSHANATCNGVACSSSAISLTASWASLACPRGAHGKKAISFFSQ